MAVGIHKDLYKHIEATGARRPFKELVSLTSFSLVFKLSGTPVAPQKSWTKSSTHSSPVFLSKAQLRNQRVHELPAHTQNRC